MVQVESVVLAIYRDFPWPGLGPLPNSKMSKKFPKWCISLPNFFVLH